MPASRAAGARPRDTFLDGEVDLERAGAVTEPAVRAGDAARQADRRGCRRRSTATRPASARRSAGGRRPRSRAHRSRSCRRGVRCRRPTRRRSPASRLRPPPSPLACPATISISPTALVIGRSRREKACAATPAQSALSLAPSSRAEPASVAGSIAAAPKRASVNGWRGTRRIGWEASANKSSNRDAIGANTSTPSLTVAPQAVGGPIDRSIQHAGRSVVERMGTVDRRLQPGEAARDGEVQPGQER